MEEKITVSDLKKLITALDNIPSKTGSANYKSIRVIGNTVSLKRESSGNEVSISINELFNVYSNEDFINTTILRDYITGYVYSPACAVLMATGLYDRKGYRAKNMNLDSLIVKSSEAIEITAVEKQNTFIRTPLNQNCQP